MHRQTGTRIAAWAVGLCLLTTGCIPLAYVYPTAEFVPATPTNAPRDEVKAIRVDAVQSHSPSYLDYKERILLKEVALGKEGQVPAQLTAGIDRGWVWNCVVLTYSGHTHRTVEVKLYRRSYQTAVLKPGEKTGTLAWQPADDLAARVQALDDLLGPVVQPVWHNNQVSDDLDFLWGLAPGSAGREHKKVLLWAADEYEALAQDEKAKRVRALAEQ
jgi:hypothetical protein